MKRTGGQWLAGLAAVAVLAAVAHGGANLRLGFEDRNDPNPRQVAIGAEIAGLALGFAISWSHGSPALDLR